MYGPDPSSDAFTLVLGALVSVAIVVAVIWATRRANANGGPPAARAAKEQEYQHEAELQPVGSVENNQEADVTSDRDTR